MPLTVSDSLVKLIALDQAAALLAEFGAGAALFANGQLLEAQRIEAHTAATFWSAVLRAVACKPVPSGDDLQYPVAAGPDRVTHRAWQDDAAVARPARMRKAVAMDAKRTASKRRRVGIRG